MLPRQPRADIPPEALPLSRRAIERYAEFRVINRRRHDGKAFDDAERGRRLAGAFVRQLQNPRLVRLTE